MCEVQPNDHHWDTNWAGLKYGQMGHYLPTNSTLDIFYMTSQNGSKESTFTNMKNIPAQSKLISSHKLSTKINTIIKSVNLDNIIDTITNFLPN